MNASYDTRGHDTMGSGEKTEKGTAAVQFAFKAVLDALCKGGTAVIKP